MCHIERHVSLSTFLPLEELRLVLLDLERHADALVEGRIASTDLSQVLPAQFGRRERNGDVATRKTLRVRRLPAG